MGKDKGIVSAIRLMCTRTGKPSPTASGADVVVASSNQFAWRSPLVFELHRMSDQEYGEHKTIGHQLMINLGAPVRLGWLEDGRRRESTFDHEQMCVQSDGDSNAPRWKGALTFATASIDPTFVGTLLDDRAPQASELFPKRHCVAAAAPAAFARTLAHELLSPTEPLYAETLSLAFVLQLLTDYGRTAGPKHLAPKGKLGALQLRNVIEFAHAHLATGLTLEVMARVAGYSPFQFARLFKRTTGWTPHRFVLSLRLERACRLLLDGAELADVALGTGFYDQAHFTNAFRSAYGVTPAAYSSRRRTRKIFQSSEPTLGDGGRPTDAHDSPCRS